MLSFIALPMPAKTILVTLFFLTLCAGVCTCFVVGKKQGGLRFLLLLLFTASIGAVMLLYTSMIPAERAKPNIPAIAIRFSEWPVLLPTLLWLIALFYFLYVIRTEWMRRRMTITLSSIKESLDHLQSGLCFAQPNGLVLLTNHRMNELSHALFDLPLQNANLFWKALQNGNPRSGVVRLLGGNHPEFRLSDNSIWRFSFEKLDSVVQIAATNTTRQHELIEKLRIHNRELEAMNARIRSYGEKVDEYVISRERLETRVNLHGFLGQSLLMTRHYLQNKTGDSKRILDMWQRNIDVLRLEAEPQPDTDSLASLKNAANAIGMQVHLQGAIPASQHLRKLIASIGAEALTNAVRHAGARQLFIDASETDIAYMIRYTNDGAVPAYPITEGGGLSNARKKAEAAGCIMTVESAPQFALILSIRKEVTHRV